MLILVPVVKSLVYLIISILQICHSLSLIDIWGVDRLGAIIYKAARMFKSLCELKKEYIKNSWASMVAQQ